MSISYKTLWQEVSQQNQQLQEKIKRAEQQHRREIEKLYAFIEGNRGTLNQTQAIVDLAGIARHMRVARFTPQQWAQRDLLPPVDFPEIKEPLWYASTIRTQFAQATGRPWYDDPEAEGELSPAA